MDIFKYILKGTNQLKGVEQKTKKLSSSDIANDDGFASDGNHSKVNYSLVTAEVKNKQKRKRDESVEGSNDRKKFKKEGLI